MIKVLRISPWFNIKSSFNGYVIGVGTVQPEVIILLLLITL